MASIVNHSTFTPATYYPLTVTGVIKPGTYDSSHPASAFETIPYDSLHPMSAFNQVSCDFDGKTFDPLIHSCDFTRFNSNSEPDLIEDDDHDDSVFPIPSYHEPITTSFTTTESIGLLRSNLSACFAKESVLFKIKNNNYFECSALCLHNVINFIVTVYRNDKDLLLIEIHHINGCRNAFKKLFNNILNDMGMSSSEVLLEYEYSKGTNFLEDPEDSYLKHVGLTGIMDCDPSDYQLDVVRSTAIELESLANALESMPGDPKTYEYFKKCLGPGGFWVKMVLDLIELTQSLDVHMFSNITAVAMSGVAEMARAAFLSSLQSSTSASVELDTELLESIQVCFKFIHVTTPYHVRHQALCVASYFSRINKEYIDLD